MDKRIKLYDLMGLPEGFTIQDIRTLYEATGIMYYSGRTDTITWAKGQKGVAIDTNTLTPEEIQGLKDIINGKVSDNN